MAGPVLDISDELLRLAIFPIKFLVHQPTEQQNEVKIFPFIVATDVVDLSRFSFVENGIYSSGVVLDIQPIADVLSLSVNRQRFLLDDVVDHKRDQLLGEV